MNEIKNKNDLAQNADKSYVNAYSPEEHELNKRLDDECLKENIDFALVEEVLKQGADPLGPTQGGEWNELEHVYEEIVSEMDPEAGEQLPRLTELFLKYGMDVEHPRVPYDGGNSINPLWSLGLCLGEHSLETLKLFLDYGISVDSFREFWSTAMGDIIDVECGDPVNSAFWNRACVLSLQATMLAASYDYILNGYEHLRDFIGYSHNDYDLHKFRNWNDFTYEFDTSHCKRHYGHPELCESIVTIYEVETNKAVWKFGVYLDESDIQAGEDLWLKN